MCFGIYFSTEACHINQYWENLDKHLEQVQRYIKKIPGDGFCFIKSVLEGLQEDHKVVIDIEVAQHEILDHLIEQHRDYVAYHAEDENEENQQFCNSIGTDSDVLVADFMDFFNDRNFDRNIVDLLAQVTANALGITVFIYEENRGHIEMLKYDGGPCSKNVYVKFQHSPLSLIGNHYDAVLQNTKLLPTQPWSPSAFLPIQIIKNEKLEEIKQEHSSDEESIYISSGSNIIDLEIKEEIDSDDNDALYIVEPIESNEDSDALEPCEVLMKGLEECQAEGNTSIPQDAADMTSETSEQCESEENPYIIEEKDIPTISRGKPFPTWLFKNQQVEHVTSLPGEIDGLQIFELNTSDETWTSDTSDLRYFNLKTSSKLKFTGTIKGGICLGSWICPNNSCTF